MKARTMTSPRSLSLVKDAPDRIVPRSKPKPQKGLDCRQREEEIVGLCQPNATKHVLYGMMPHFAIYGLGMWYQLTVSSLIGNLAVSFVVGWQLYVLFILHHDCVHGSAFRHDFFNRLWGRIYAMTFMMTFSVNRETHMRHHAFISDRERDPDNYYFSGKMRHMWLRIWIYSYWYTRIALTRYGKRVRSVVLIEQAFNLVLWTVVHIVLFRAGMAIKALYIFWLPVAVLALVINPITRGYEHAPLTLYDKEDPRRLDMRTNAITIANPVYGWLCANLSYHVEHHAYPRCPFFNLQKLHRIFQQEGLQYLVAPYPLYRIWKGARMTEGMTCNADSSVDSRSA